MQMRRSRSSISGISDNVAFFHRQFAFLPLNIAEEMATRATNAPARRGECCRSTIEMRVGGVIAVAMPQRQKTSRSRRARSTCCAPSRRAWRIREADSPARAHIESGVKMRFAEFGKSDVRMLPASVGHM
jgi:hypothetical protein